MGLKSQKSILSKFHKMEVRDNKSKENSIIIPVIIPSIQRMTYICEHAHTYDLVISEVYENFIWFSEYH